VIVTAALCWWNEKPEDLDACVRGAASVADRFVALDGAYRRYPGATPRSSDAEVAAIRDAAAEVGLECLILQPDRLWKGAVEKRSYCMAMAAYESDWIIVVDTDHVISAFSRAAVRRELEITEEDSLTVPFVTPAPEGRSLAEVSATNWHTQQANVTVNLPQIYRALPGIRVDRNHWEYSGVKGGQRSWIHNSGHGPDWPHLPQRAIRSAYKVEHRCLFRSQEQILAQRAYYNDRDMIVRRTGQEDDEEGLPAPVWDYTTRPF
jgi:hypothetical protein